MFKMHTQIYAPLSSTEYSLGAFLCVPGGGGVLVRCSILTPEIVEKLFNCPKNNEMSCTESLFSACKYGEIFSGMLRFSNM